MKAGKNGITSNTPKNILFGAGTIHKGLIVLRCMGTHTVYALPGPVVVGDNACGVDVCATDFPQTCTLVPGEGQELMGNGQNTF